MSQKWRRANIIRRGGSSQGATPSSFLHRDLLSCQWKQAGTLNVSKDPDKFFARLLEISQRSQRKLCIGSVILPHKFSWQH